MHATSILLPRQPHAAPHAASATHCLLCPGLAGRSAPCCWRAGRRTFTRPASL